METFLILNGYELAADVDDATSTLRKISTKNSIARFYKSLLIPSVSQSAMLDIVFSDAAFSISNHLPNPR